MAKQTTITIETDSLLILRGRSSRHGWCQRCKRDVELIAMEDTAIVTNLQQSVLEEWINSDEIHRFRAPDGSGLTCLDSLLSHVQKTPTS